MQSLQKTFADEIRRLEALPDLLRSVEDADLLVSYRGYRHIDNALEREKTRVESSLERVGKKKLQGELRQEKEKSARWYQETKDAIESVSRVTLTALTERQAESGRKDTCPTEGLEVRFSSGAVAFVSQYQDYDEMTALVDANRKGYLNGCYVSKKYGLCRGSAVCWYMAQRSKRSYQNPERTRKSCALELYRRADGNCEAWN